MAENAAFLTILSGDSVEPVHVAFDVGRLNSNGGVMLAEIEREFLMASRDGALINALGKKLQHYGVFQDYEDRFFALVKASKQ